MKYHDSKWMHVVNGISEFLLIVAAYVCSGLFRAISPIGQYFYLEDIAAFLPLGISYAVVMVICYASNGDYTALNKGGGIKQLLKLMVVDLIGFALTATILFVFQLTQFSRVLLFYFYMFSVIFIFVKRYICEKLAAWYITKNRIVQNVLLIGSGDLAKRFYEGTFCKPNSAMAFAGYLAEQECRELPGYLGTPEELHLVLEKQTIHQIVVAQDEQSASWIRRLMAIAEEYHIQVGIIPVFGDFVTARSESANHGTVRMYPLRMLDTCNIMGVNIGVTNMQKALKLIETQLQTWRGKYICVANVHTTVTAHEDADYQKVQNNAVIALPDGGPLSQYSREKGYTDAARVTGPDLMQEVLKISGEKGWRHYFYGSTEKTLADLKKNIEARYPGAVIAGMYSPPFRELTPQEDAEIVAMINGAKPDFVWVGLGAPKQERWMAAHEDRVMALMVGVGAAFDYEAGNIQRAPMWMQKRNLEWLYRLLQDPKRLFKRYLTTNAKYLLWKWRNS